MVVSHRERRITVDARTSDGTWSTRQAISGGRVRVTSLEAELVVDEVYRGSSIA